MRSTVTLIMFFTLWLNVAAQVPSKMSYQAVIRDAGGNLVTNHQIGMRITILEGNLPGTSVYQETQTPVTNANGLVTIGIGGGAGFSAINWGSGLHYIKTEIDPAGGTAYSIIATSQLLSVPYALYAKTAGNGFSGNYADLSGIPAGFADGIDNVDDADNNPANEIQNLTLNGSQLSLSNGGGSVNLPGDNWGSQTVTTDLTLSGNGLSGTPLKLADNGVTASKILDGTITASELATGAVTTSRLADNAVTVAKLPTGAAADKYLRGDGTWAVPSVGIVTETDPTWSGAANETSDIGRTGRVGIGTTVPSALLHTEGTGTGAGNVLFSGLYKNTAPGDPPASGPGTRMMWYPDKAAFRVGQALGFEWSKDSIGNYSVAMGYGTKAKVNSTAFGVVTTASGYASTSMGYFTTAPGETSTAMGIATKASGRTSTAIGNTTKASGDNSTAMGAVTTASGYASTASGYYTSAPSFVETAIGTLNTDYVPFSAADMNANDRLFVIGNGTSLTSKSDAMTVLKNGNTGFGVSRPSGKMHVFSNSEMDFPQLMLEENDADYARLMFRNTNTQDKDWTIAGGGNTSDADSRLNFYYFDGNAGSNIVTISGEKKVGIGTENPAARLHVSFDSDILNPQLLLTENSDDYARLMFKNTDTPEKNWTIAAYNSPDNADSKLNFYYDSGSSAGDIVSISGNGRVGINTGSPAFNLEVNGSAGKPGGGSWSTSSDIRLKNLRGNYTRGLEEIAALRPVKFVYRENNPRKLPSGTEQVGFIAQEVQKIFPEAVSEGADGYLDFNMHAVNVALVNAVRELKVQNEQQQKTIESLESRLSKLESLLEATSRK